MLLQFHIALSDKGRSAPVLLSGITAETVGCVLGTAMWRNQEKIRMVLYLSGHGIGILLKPGRCDSGRSTQGILEGSKYSHKPYRDKCKSRTICSQRMEILSLLGKARSGPAWISQKRGKKHVSIFLFYLDDRLYTYEGARPGNFRDAVCVKLRKAAFLYPGRSSGGLAGRTGTAGAKNTWGISSDPGAVSWQ